MTRKRFGNRSRGAMAAERMPAFAGRVSYRCGADALDVAVITAGLALVTICLYAEPGRKP